jgi:hypothetical protein
VGKLHSTIDVALQAVTYVMQEHATNGCLQFWIFQVNILTCDDVSEKV